MDINYLTGDATNPLVISTMQSSVYLKARVGVNYEN